MTSGMCQLLHVVPFCPPDVPLGPPWCSLLPELHSMGDFGEWFSPAKSAPRKASTVEQERIVLPGDGIGRLASNADGCLF